MIGISKVCIMMGGILSLLMVVFHTRFYKLFQSPSLPGFCPGILDIYG
jgi:hypothetical protein